MALSDGVVGKFFGVYLLCSQSSEKRYNGKCYIGFTVNPNRRIKQHNRGKDFGGAKKTSNKGPWQMVMIVHGFPNNIAALQFEWAWQQPTLSSRLKNYIELKRKAVKETYFQYNVRILNRMLHVGPWNRLPLTIRWLEAEFERQFDHLILPPPHMNIVSGKISISKASKKLNRNGADTVPPRTFWASECHLCMEVIDNPERTRIGCLNNMCKLTCHVICLANHLIAADARNRGHYIPIGGECPLCETEITWAALLQRKINLQNLAAGVTDNSDEESIDDDDEAISVDNSIDEEDINYITNEDPDEYNNFNIL